MNTLVEQSQKAPRQQVLSKLLLAGFSFDDMAAALRFHETTTDDGTYDISIELRRRLQQLGLVKHKGGGHYEETDLMLSLLPELDKALWAVHIQGPDDVVPVASKDEAVFAAKAINDDYLKIKASLPDDDMTPRINAVPIVWDGTPEFHAEFLASGRTWRDA